MTRRPELRSKRFVRILLVLGAMLVAMAPNTDAARRVIKFSNTTGKVVDDLHIETNQGCSVDFTGTTPFDSERGVNGGNRHNLYNGTVPIGGSATVTLTADSETITIDKWWWTVGGNALRDGDRVGPEKKDDGGAVLSFFGGLAAGDGEIAVSIGRRMEFFQTVEGDSPEAAARSFMVFLDGFADPSFDLIHNVLVSPVQVVALGNLLGNPAEDLEIEITRPDSGLLVDVRPIEDRVALAVDGVCPGPVQLIASGVAPFAPVAFVYGFSEGSVLVPDCFGLRVDLRNPVILGVVPADEFGTAVFGGNAPPAACGRVLLQAVDVAACATSGVVLLD